LSTCVFSFLGFNRKGNKKGDSYLKKEFLQQVTILTVSWLLFDKPSALLIFSDFLDSLVQ